MWNPGTESQTSLWKKASRCSLRAFILAVVASLTAVGFGASDASAGAERGGSTEAVASPTTGESTLAPTRSEPSIPEELGTLVTRFGGSSELPRVFVIGESHVNLEVQQAVRGTLEYLRGAFGVRVIASEGFSGPMPLPVRVGSQSARYVAAGTEFRSRHINAVEYMALVYPEIEVVGVTDMEAYRRHRDVLDDLGKRSKVWVTDFQSFVEEEVATLRVGDREGRRIVAALRDGLESGDLSELEGLLCEVVGSASSACRKVATLAEQRQELGELQDTVVSSDHPLMQRRDRGLVGNTLALNAEGPVALVVGYFHVSGIERELRKQEVAYWVLVPPGVREQEHTPDDDEVMTRWTEGRPTELERWLKETGLKPPPALSREGLRRHMETFEALVQSDRLLLEGHGEEEVVQLMGRGRFPAGFKVERCFQIRDGHGIQFTAGSRRGYAYFTDGPPPGAPGYEEIEQQELPTGRSVVIYGGGSGQPPEPPIDGPTLGAADPGDHDPWRRVYLAIDRQEESRPEALTVVFQEDGNRVFRFVNKRLRVLPASPEWIRERRRRLDEHPPTERKLRAAQELAKVLLMDLDEDLPPGERSVLHQLSAPGLPGSYSLPTLAELARHPMAERLRSFTEVYWSRLDNPDLEEILSTPSRPVEIEKTVVWIADALRSRPGYERLVEALERSGAGVNRSPREEETLVLIGSPESEWVATLGDGAVRRIGTEELRRDLGATSAVVALGAALSEEDRSATRRFHRLEVTAEQALETGRRLLEALARDSGRKPLDEVLREETPGKTVELREELARGADIQSLVESSLVAEHATTMNGV